MDYEKKYKEALEWARKVMQGKVGFVLDEVLEKFPELKESEDEKIRQFLIHEVTETSDKIMSYRNMNKKDILAWLEKQDKPVEINPTEFDTRLQTLIGKFDSLPKEELIGSLGFWLNVVQNDGTYKPVEKQGEKKTVPDWMPKFLDELRSKKNYFDWDEHREIEGGILAIIKWMKPNYFNVKDDEQKHWDSVKSVSEEDKLYLMSDEQKPTDKVEPKFRVGDIITNGKIICKVDENDNNKYHGWFGYDKDISVHYADIPDIENWHKWTIQDAKEGDVLATNSWLYIFKYTNNKALIQFYCTCPINRKPYKWCFLPDDSYLDIYIDANIYPATKEQRDALEKAMADAGWEFDFEKKELKKIEDEIEIPFGAKDSELQEVTYFIPKGFHAEIDDDKVVIKKGEKPTEWSEEDERSIRDSIFYLKSAKKYFEKDDDILWDEKWFSLCIKWLESLYKRLQPQNQWKPSEEQMIALNYVINLMASSASPKRNDYYYNVFKNLRKQLKKLMEE